MSTNDTTKVFYLVARCIATSNEKLQVAMHLGRRNAAVTQWLSTAVDVIDEFEEGAHRPRRWL